MPIYRGNREITKVYRGDRKIAKIYRGDRIVYSAKKRVLLFNDVYKAVYAKGVVSAQVFNYNAPSFDPTLRKYEFTYNGYFGTYFYRQSSTINLIKNNNIRLGGNDNAVDLPTNKKVDVVIDKDKLYVDNAFISTLTIGNTLDTYLYLVLRIYNYEFYELKIYDNDVLVYHFVPAYKILSNGDLVYGIAELTGKEFAINPKIIGEPEYE